MTFDYASLAATATSLLTRFGQTMAIRRTSGATYNAVTGAVSGGTTADTNVKGLFVAWDERYDGEASKAGTDRIAVLDATLEPLVSDRLLVSSVAYEIVAVQQVNPAGTPLVYRVQVRT